MLSQLVKQSPSWAAWNYSHVQFITIPLPPGVQCITQNKISIKLFWIQDIKQYQTQLFWAWCLNKIKTHQIILEKKIKREKLSHPWESKKAREIWRACYYVQKGHGFRENLVSVIVSTFLIFMFVDQLLLVDVFSQLYYLTYAKKQQCRTYRYKSLKSWKIDNIDLTQQFSLSIFTDFRYQSIKITWLPSIFIDTKFYRLTTPGQE